MSDQVNNNATNQKTEQQAQFDIIRIYSKDLSLETPNSPAIFQEEWNPELKVEFDARPTRIDETKFEVCLRVTVTCQSKDKVAFICEVNQAGIFFIQNLPADAIEYLLGATAPNILFPYARETISNLVTRASFPQLNIAPINFEAIFRARKAQLAQEQAKAKAESSVTAQASNEQ